MFPIRFSLCFSILFVVLSFIPTARLQAGNAAKDEPPPPRLTIALYSGLTFGNTDWYFIQSAYRFPVHSAFTIGGAIQYGPIFRLDGAQLSASIEVAHGEIGTDEQDISNQIGFHRDNETYRALMSVERMPIMFWLSVSSDSRLSPFIRGGLGTSRTDFRELYSFPSGPSVSFHRWGFTWGIGGGLDFRVSPSLDLSLFLDDWITTVDLLDVTSTGGENGLDAPYKMTAVGLRTAIHF